MYNLQELLEKYCSNLPGLKIVDCGASVEVRWTGSHGVLVHKDSDENAAKVLWEANPYNPQEKRVEWTLLEAWLRKNVT